MGLETRHGRTYYYKKRRVGNRVISEYCGSGEVGKLMFLWDQLGREEDWSEKETKRRSFEAEKLKQDEIDQVIDAFCQDAKVFEDALFLINGYHIHSRQWRRKAK